MVEVESKDGIFTIYIPKAFTNDTVMYLHSALDSVEMHEGPTVLIISSKTPKIFNAGMDLKFLAKNGPPAVGKLFGEMMKLFGRVMELGIPTIAAMNGHAVAGGLMLALSCDYRVLNNASTVKMTEITLGMPLPRGGNHVLNAKLTPDVQRDLVLRAKIFQAQEALSRKIVDHIVDESKVMEKAVEIAKEVIQYGEKKQVYSLLKTSTYFQAIHLAKNAASSADEISFSKNPKI